MPAHTLNFALAIAGLVFSQAASAAASCELSISDPGFGNYASGQPAAVDTNGSIRVDCSNDGSAETLSYSLAIGRSSNGQFEPRALQGADDTLRYNLYVDAARSLVWGDGQDGTLSVAGEIALPGAGSNTHVVYGRLHGLQQVLPGAYVDALIVEISY